MPAHPLAEILRCSIFQNIDKVAVRYKGLGLGILFQHATMMNIIEQGKEKPLKFLHGLIAGDLVQFSVEPDLVLNIEQMELGLWRFPSYNFAQFLNVCRFYPFIQQIGHTDLQHQPDLEHFFQGLLRKDMRIEAAAQYPKNVRIGNNSPPFLFAFYQAHHPQPE